MLLSQQEASLLRCKQFICVEEKKHSEPGGRGGPMEREDVRHNTPNHRSDRNALQKLNAQRKCIVLTEQTCT